MRIRTIVILVVLALMAAAIVVAARQGLESKSSSAPVLEKQRHDVEVQLEASRARVLAAASVPLREQVEALLEQTYLLARAVGKSHPEQGDDETFITNTTIEGYSRIGWKSKRLGTVAFGPTGKVVGRVSPEVRDKLIAEAAKMPAREYDTMLWGGNYFSRPRLKPILRSSNPDLERAIYVSLPVFAKRSEMVAAGVDPDRKR